MSNNFLPTRPKRKFEHQIPTFYEGKQEFEYFNHLRNLINNHANNILKLKLVPKNCEGGDPRTPVKSAINNCSQNKTPIVVFDYDNKKSEFEEAIDLAVKNKFEIAYSNINFDYWLALHKLSQNEIIYGEKNNNDAYVKILKKCYGLSNSDDIKENQVINKILKKISFEDVCNAIENCKLIENRNIHTPGQKHNTPCSNAYYSNPDIQIYKVVEKIIKKCIAKED